MRLIFTILTLFTLVSCETPSTPGTMDLDSRDCGTSCPGDAKIPLVSLVGSVASYYYYGVAMSPITFTSSNIDGCTLVGTLPSGLNFNSIDCSISGLPTALTPVPGTNVSVKGYVGSTETTPIVINIKIIIPPPSISLSTNSVTTVVNTAITPVSVSANQTLVSCSFTGSTVAGLSYNTSLCTVSGTPTATTTGSIVTIVGTNANGSSNSVTLNIVVNPAAPVITGSVSNATVKKDSAITPITFTTTQALTFCESIAALPAGLSISSTTCAITGTPTALTIQAGTIIQVRAYGLGGASNTVNITFKTYKNFCDGMTNAGVNANAASAHPLYDGSSAVQPIVLCGVGGLNYLSANGTSGLYFRLQSDINLSAYSPITTAFVGHLDGAGHTLTGLNVNAVGVDDVGLFKTVGDSSFNNLILNSFTILGASRVGSLVGSVNNLATVTASNIIIKNSNLDTNGGSIQSGMLVGYLNASSTFSLTDSLVYGNNANTTGGATRVFVGSSAGTPTFTRSVYDQDLITSYGYTANAATTSKTLIEIATDTNTYTGFSADWDLSPLGGSSPATLIVKKDRVYSDVVEAVN